MKLRTPRHLTLLALVAPALAVVALPQSASATRPDRVATAHIVDEWTDYGAQLPAGAYSRVEVTYDATYGITLDGQVRTALTFADRTRLVAPAFDRPIVDVTGGTAFGLAIDDQGALRVWGDAPTIPAVDRAETYRDVAASDTSAIGLTTDGELRYWGSQNAVFDGAAVAASDIVSIDTTGWAAVAVTADGRVLSAGGSITGEWSPAWAFPADRADETFVAADAGHEFAVALTDDGEVVAWGVDNHAETHVPELPPGRYAVAVSAGMWMAGAVLDDGSVITWGEGERTRLPAARTGVPAVDLDLDRYRVAVTYASLASTTVPTISGTPEFGEELTATAGDWTETPDEVHYQWHVHPNGGPVRDVGTDSPTYVPTAQDALDWGTVSVTVTAAKDGYVGASATSAQTDHVAQKEFTSAPTVTVTGEAHVGSTLTATTTAAVPAPDTAEITWFSIDPDDEFGLESLGTGPTLALTADLVGAQVSANVTAYKEGYQPAHDDSPLLTVAAAPAPPVVTPPVITPPVTTPPVVTPPVVTDPIADPITGPVALGATTLSVKAPRKVVAGKRTTIVVTGLAAGEKVTVKIAGKRTVARADAAGVARVKVKVTGKPGKRTVTVTGSRADRAGRTTLKVVAPKRR